MSYEMSKLVLEKVNEAVDIISEDSNLEFENEHERELLDYSVLDILNGIQSLLELERNKGGI